MYAGAEPIWPATNDVSVRTENEIRGRMSARELSPTRLRLRAELQDGWICESFRFSGQRHAGAESEVPISPNFRFGQASALIEARRGIRRSYVRLPAEVIGPPAQGAAYQTQDGRWKDLTSTLPLDVGLVEGRPLSCRWRYSADQEVWLMLGDQPLFPEPDLLRRQHIGCCGEPLYLRFGLMHEDYDSRITLAPATYETGLLAAIEWRGSEILLHLKEQIQRADEFRVWIWERKCAAPRCLDPLEVELVHEAKLLVLRDSVEEPLGWLLSWQGLWRGARFHVEPESLGWERSARDWCQVFEETLDWSATAKALHAWHFPALMEPFLESIRRKVGANRFSTLDAWTSKTPVVSNGALLEVDSGRYLSAIRGILPLLQPNESVPPDIFEHHVKSVLEIDWQHTLYEPAEVLLRGQPVLLAQLLVAAIKKEFGKREKLIPAISTRNLFHKERDPRKMAELRHSTEFVVKIILERLNVYAGVLARPTKPDDLSFLHAAALHDLRSWVDSSPVDSMFFTSCVTEPAERWFLGEQPELKWVQVAIARSTACCAFLAAHLLCRYLYHDLRTGIL